MKIQTLIEILCAMSDEHEEDYVYINDNGTIRKLNENDINSIRSSQGFLISDRLKELKINSKWNKYVLLGKLK